MLMRITTSRPGGHRGERGSVTPFMVIITAALFTVAGLVIDGGYALAAQRQAMTTAQQAARAGADALNTGSLRGGQPRVDPGRATTAATAYLHSVGAHGTVTINGGEVTVTVTTRQHTTLLAAAGIGTITVTATGTARSINQNDHP
jgi:Flp pilus assembly protein TadG